MGKKRALLSVSDKTGIVDFAQDLIDLDIDIISTGGTAQVLKDANIPLHEVSEITGFPEMLDGRVKTLHPIIHAGVLAKRDEKQHMALLKKHHIDPVDIVVVNLYPFESTVQKPKVSMEEIIENIDIGGPTLLRAAAKNYHDVIVICNVKRYQDVLTELKNTQTVSLKTRQLLALEAFSHTAQYDTIISTYLRTHWTDELLPHEYSVTMRKLQNMRYGENPHQQASFYTHLPPTDEPCISNAKQLHGKELSFNNILDADCAIECIKEFPKQPTCVIIKHATPCGIASAATCIQAWKDAFATDEDSPYGGIVAFNREFDEAVAGQLKDFFLEVIIAPSYSKKALSLMEKKKNLRLLTLPGLKKPINRKGVGIRSVTGGFLVQERDVYFSEKNKWKVATKRKPTAEELATMEFAVRCVRHVKSNSVLFAKDTKTIAIGGGQTSRVDAAWIATHKGKQNIKNSVMASDAFFPFRDAVDVAAQAGVTAIIQPGGSIRDNEVIDAANEHNIAMVFSGQRYFRH